MKRIVLFLLAVVMTFGVAACSDSDSTDTTINFTLRIRDNCNGTYSSVEGVISHMSSNFITPVLSLQPGQSQTMQFPEAGQYVFHFSGVPERGFPVWKFTRTIADGTVEELSCR